MENGSRMRRPEPCGRPLPIAGRWPLRGRDPALQRAMHALSDGHGCVLVGEAGVGKTRLAQEILDAAHELGHPTRWVIATQAARSIAFGAVAHLLPPPGGGENGSLGMLQRTLAALASSEHERRLVLGVDDAHLLDDSSSALLHMAASMANVLVVMTARANVEAAEPVTTLWKEGLADRIELEPLERPHTIALAADILGGNLDRRTEHLLWKATRGNPLYLRELLISGLDGGQLEHVDDLWRWRGPLRVGSRLAEVIGGRLTGMSQDLREALEIVAVAEHLELSLFERLAGEAMLAQAERHGFITITSDGHRHGVRLLHPLYAEVLRQSVPEHRMRRILGALVEVLEATGARRRGDLLRSCDWRVRAGLPVPDVTLLAGARLARETGDGRLAERLLGLVDQDSASNGTRLLLSDALFTAARPAEAERLLASLDLSSLAEHEAAEATLMRVDNLTYRLGRAGDAQAVLDGVARAMPGEPPWLPCCRALLAAVRGDFATALEALPAGSVPEDLSWLAVALIPLASVSAHAGDFERAIALLDRAQSAAEKPGVYTVRQRAMVDRLLYAVVGGYLDQSPVERIYAAAVPGEDRRGLWFVATLAGMKALWRGDAAAARRWAAELAGIAHAVSSGPAVALGHAVRARLLALLGDAEAAEAALTRMEEVREPEVGVFDAELARARCAVAAAGADPSGAGDLALRAADEALGLGQRAMAVLHGHDAARHGQVRAAAARIEDVAGGMTGPLLPVVANHVLAWSRGDAGAIEAASKAYADVGAYLPAAEASTTASQLHQASGRRTAAAAAGARAAVLRERCAGCHTAVLDDARLPSPLTQRELQVTRLAARGLSNRQIAAELGISVRTVETHVQRAYNKLGVADRFALGPSLDSP
jgi:ATP/maltotriose-dependent transcriptional regulator MalT